MGERESPAERRARRAAVEDPGVVLNAAARYLEARSRSVAEVRRHLLTSGYRPSLVEGAVGRMIELGFLDDEAFARSWVASRDRARPRGERALRFELGRKGIDDATIRSVLAERGSEVDPLASGYGRGVTGVDEEEDGGEEPRSADEAAAERLLAKKASTIGRAGDPRVRRQKAYALLARNGFAPEIAARLSERVARLEDDVTDLD